MARTKFGEYVANLGIADYFSPLIVALLFLLHTKTHLFDYPIFSHVMDFIVSPRLWYWIVLAGCLSLVMLFLKKSPPAVIRGAIFGGLAGTLFGSAVSAYLFAQGNEAYVLFLFGVVAYIGHLTLTALVLKKIKL